MADEREFIIHRPHDGTIVIPRSEIMIRDMVSGDMVTLRECGAIFRDRRFDAPVIIPGQTYVALVPPVLMTGPNKLMGYDNATITWTTDIPAFHRARSKRMNPLGSWIETVWSTPASTNASILISGLVGEHEGYWFDVQSCAIGDGSMSFPWTPGDNTFYGFTTCTSAASIVYSNFDAVKMGTGKLTYLQLRWNTNFVCKNPEVDGSWLAPNLTGTGSRTTSFAVNDVNFKFLDGVYSWICRNKNMCSIWGNWSSPAKFFQVSGGAIVLQW